MIQSDSSGMHQCNVWYYVCTHCIALQSSYRWWQITLATVRCEVTNVSIPVLFQMIVWVGLWKEQLRCWVLTLWKCTCCLPASFVCLPYLATRISCLLIPYCLVNLHVCAFCWVQLCTNSLYISEWLILILNVVPYYAIHINLVSFANHIHSSRGKYCPKICLDPKSCIRNSLT